MEAARNCETSVNFYQTTRRNNLEVSHLQSFYFVLQKVFELIAFLCYRPTCQQTQSWGLPHEPQRPRPYSYLHFWTWFYSVKMLLQRLHTIKPAAGSSRLTLSIHWSSAVFQYQEFERRTAQDTLMGCAGLHNQNKSEGCEHSLCIVLDIVRVAPWKRIAANGYCFFRPSGPIHAWGVSVLLQWEVKTQKGTVQEWLRVIWHLSLIWWSAD
jgi:hypothetical protein